MNSTARKIVCEFEGDIETAVSALDIVDLADHEAGEPLAWKKSSCTRCNESKSACNIVGVNPTEPRQAI